MRLYPGSGEMVARATGFTVERCEELLSNPRVAIISPGTGCIFIGQEIMDGAILVHQFAEEGFRGRQALRAAREAVRWVWENTPYVKIVGFTPANNRPACTMAIAAGFRREGLLKGARVEEDGTVCDVVVFGLCKGEG